MIQDRPLEAEEVRRFSEGPVWRFLHTVGALAQDNLRVLGVGTRDTPTEVVLRDVVSGLVFLPESSFQMETYFSDAARSDEKVEWLTKQRMDSDTARRLETLNQFFIGKKVLDFGCGRGVFLKAAADLSSFSAGVEPVPGLRRSLVERGIICGEKLQDLYCNSQVQPGFFDTVVMFHVLEHLENPLVELAAIREGMVQGGHLIVEVPHANSLLAEISDNFFRFNLWSQHLVLHTRSSLKKTLQKAGFTSVRIVALQRYPLSNFLHWLAKGKGGGHLDSLSLLDSRSLTEVWEQSLASLDRTDTLLAIASFGSDAALGDPLS